MCGPATGRHPSPSSGSTRHELRSAVEKGYAVLGCRPQRRVTGPLSAERTIKRLSPAIPSSEPYFSGCYRQHRACRSKNQAETARGCGCSPAQISIAHRRCPRFPSSGAFRRRPGSRRPAHGVAAVAGGAAGRAALVEEGWLAGAFLPIERRGASGRAASGGQRRGRVIEPVRERLDQKGQKKMGQNPWLC